MVRTAGRRVRIALVTVGALVSLTACGGGEPTGTASDGATDAASPSGTASASSRPSSTVPAADPDHAVDPPGPRGPLLSADLLVFSAKTLSKDDIAKIKDLKQVTGVETMSMGQASVENHVLDVAAVDPGSYRAFTPLKTADAQVVWDRVAGGEVAVDDNARSVLKADEDGYIRLGSAKDAQRIHVGAYAPQVTGLVDAVVNKKWGEELGLPPDNALIVSTTMTAPDRVQKPIEKIVGKDVTVSRLDVVAREGLDPGAYQNAVVVGSVKQAVGSYRYSVLGGGRIGPDPAWVREHIATEQVPIIGKMTCNKAIFPQLRSALSEIVEQGLASKIHPGEYAGCYYPRFIAGTTTLSNHAFGTAFDINVPGNGRGTAGQIDRDVVRIFKYWGFAWGGDWHYTDPMHFEMNRIVTPGG